MFDMGNKSLFLLVQIGVLFHFSHLLFMHNGPFFYLHDTTTTMLSNQVMNIETYIRHTIPSRIFTPTSH